MSHTDPPARLFPSSLRPDQVASPVRRPPRLTLTRLALQRPQRGASTFSSAQPELRHHYRPKSQWKCPSLPACFCGTILHLHRIKATYQSFHLDVLLRSDPHQSDFGSGTLLKHSLALSSAREKLPRSPQTLDGRRETRDRGPLHHLFNRGRRHGKRYGLSGLSTDRPQRCRMGKCRTRAQCRTTGGDDGPVGPSKHVQRLQSVLHRPTSYASQWSTSASNRPARAHTQDQERRLHIDVSGRRKAPVTVDVLTPAARCRDAGTPDRTSSVCTPPGRLSREEAPSADTGRCIG